MSISVKKHLFIFYDNDLSKQWKLKRNIKELDIKKIKKNDGFNIKQEL